MHMIFYCDKCGEVINNPKEGMVEWIKEEVQGKHIVHSFKIVHNPMYSPNKSKEGCYHHEHANGRSDLHLHDFLKSKDQYLASFLHLGFMHDPDNIVGCRITDFKEFSHFMRRLTIPKYEEASKYFPQALSDGIIGDENELCIFSEETLSYIIEKCKE